MNLNFMATWCLNSEKINCKYDFPYHFKKIIVCYKKIGYNIDVFATDCILGFYPVKVNNFACLFVRTTVCRASDCTTVTS